MPKIKPARHLFIMLQETYFQNVRHYFWRKDAICAIGNYNVVNKVS
jgi:hypothetical protein